MSVLQFWFVRVLYQQIYQKPATWDDLLFRIRQYGLPQSLEMVCYMSSFLCDDYNDPAVQDAVMRNLFQDKYPFVRQRLEEIKGTSTAPGFVLFSELQLVNFVKILLLELPDATTVKPNSDLTAFAEALLMVNDLVLAQQDLLIPPNHVDFSSDEWQQYFLRSSMFHHPFDWEHDIARSYKLYLTDDERLKQHPSYINLPQLAEQVLAIDLQIFWSIMFTFTEYWTNSVNRTHGAISLRQYFGDHNFEPETLNRALDFFSCEIPAVRSEVNRYYSFKSLRPYHAIPLAIHPVVRSNDQLCCISTQLLRDRLTRGLYHLFLQPTVDPSLRERFLIYMGAVFSDYVELLMERATSDTDAIYISGSQFERLISSKAADGIVLEGDSAVVMEYKATLFPLPIRSGTNNDIFRSKIKDLYFDSIDQLDATIKAIRDGKLNGMGVDLSQIKKIYPLIVTLESVAISDFQYGTIWRYIVDKGLLQGNEIRSIQVIEIGELECVETAMYDGFAFSQIIQDKLSHEWKNLSFTNHWVAERKRLHFPTVNDYLTSEFGKLRRRAVSLILDHAKDRSDLDEAIRILAYKFWELKGRTDGHDVDDWLEAESQILFGESLYDNDDNHNY